MSAPAASLRLRPPVPLPLRAPAPAKINLGLFVGGVRADGRHELVSAMQSISLADELTLEWAHEEVVGPGVEGDRGANADAHGDELVCAGVAGPPQANLAARALAAFRAATGWDAPALRLTVDKRIPVAAGLGGGSADAAAALRLAAAASGLGDERLLRELAAQLGADVPAQVTPGRWLASGVGERLQALADPVGSLGVLVLPVAARLSTAAVYAELDRTGELREHAWLAERERALRTALELAAPLPARRELLHNDLQAAAVALCPRVGEALEQAREVGAEVALVSGSGPTVLGLFAHANGLGRAQRAAAGLEGREPAPVCAVAVEAGFGSVKRVGG